MVANSPSKWCDVRMKARWKKLLWGAVLLLVVAVIWLGRDSLFSPEPMHQGKPLTAWVEQWGSNHWSRYSSATAKNAAQEAEQAILSIKDEAIPFLLNLMRIQDSAWRKKLRSKLPRQWHARLRLENRTSKLNTTGALGLAALGTNAAPAVPTLIELAYVEMNRTPPDRSDGYLPIFALGFLGQAAEPAIPVMIEALTNKNDNIHLEAAHRLGQLRLSPDLVVPALASFLDSQRNQNGNATRCAAIDSLRAYGTNASTAGPVVISMLQDPDAVVRQCATNCLPYIDRAAAVRAHLPLLWGL